MREAHIDRNCGKSGEAPDTTIEGHTPCYTNYSCFGLLVALVWL
jgi:hypothetical protein